MTIQYCSCTHSTPYIEVDNYLNCAQCGLSLPPSKQSSKPEAVNHPKHYNSHPSGIECIEVVRHMSFNVGSAGVKLRKADLIPRGHVHPSVVLGGAGASLSGVEVVLYPEDGPILDLKKTLDSSGQPVYTMEERKEP